MGFNIADHHIHALISALVGGFQHGIGLPDPGGVAQENLQLAAFVLLLFSLDAGPGAYRGRGGQVRLDIALTILLFYSIQRQIEFQDIHARFAQEAELASLGVLVHQGAHGRFAQAARLATRGSW